MPMSVYLYVFVDAMSLSRAFLRVEISFKAILFKPLNYLVRSVTPKTDKQSSGKVRTISHKVKSTKTGRM